MTASRCLLEAIIITRYLRVGMMEKIYANIAFKLSLNAYICYTYFNLQKVVGEFCRGNLLNGCKLIRRLKTPLTRKYKFKLLLHAQGKKDKFDTDRACVYLFTLEYKHC